MSKKQLVKPPETRQSVIYAYVKPVNKRWLKNRCKKDRYLSFSKWFDALIDGLRLRP